MESFSSVVAVQGTEVRVDGVVRRDLAGVGYTVIGKQITFYRPTRLRDPRTAEVITESVAIKFKELWIAP